jgi:catechol 2,3-dioxygenase-like lactoylglutathione lyase family enzyme
LATSDLDKSASFYSTLLGAPPAKLLPDYALFVTEQPGLELALDFRDEVRAASDAHYGICVETSQDVQRAIDRLSAAGLVASIEREETCCYAKQSKVWATDPDGRRWEVYTVHDNTDRRDGDSSCCGDESDSCCGELHYSDAALLRHLVPLYCSAASSVRA